MKLVISEKAIAGGRIANFLAGKEVAATAKNRATVFEFTKDGEDYMVFPLRGHVMDVDFPRHYKPWLGTDLKHLTKADINYIATEETMVSSLKKIAKDVTSVIVATDSDREGEAIGGEALAAILEENPKVPVKRAHFSAITRQDIDEAFSKLSEFDKNLADSADCRREIDLIWGAVLTRFLSLISGRLGKEFLSAGRVQTPTLGLIVDREKERLAFDRKMYWEVKAEFEKDSKKFEALHEEKRFWEKEKAEKVLSKKTGKGSVVNVESKKKTLKKPVPFNTTGFLSASTVLGFSASQAMELAEQLYQQGFISYPRTDNSTYPKTINLKNILKSLSISPDFGENAKKILAMPKIEPSKGKSTKDHPPIYPVSLAPKQKLSERQWKVYELVVRRFFATLAEDAVTNNVRVEIDVNKEIFVANGQVIIKKGWKEYYPYSKLKEVILPCLEKGNTAKLLGMEMQEKETQPPAHYSQSSLIRLMEENGLGTKATRHEILRKLYSRQYISGLKSIEPNKIAFSVIDSLDKYSKTVTKPKMTSELEKEMDKVAAGKKTREEVVKESRELLFGLLEVLLKNKGEIAKQLRAALREDSILGDCPTCEGQLRTLTGRTGKRFLGCTGYPNCRTTFPLPQKGKIMPLDKPCEACGKPTIRVIGKRYRYEMCVDMKCPSKAEMLKALEERKKKKEEAEAEKKNKAEAEGKKD